MRSTAIALAFTFSLVSLVSLVGCGPVEGQACVPSEESAVCSGSQVLLCVCDDPDEDTGECAADDGTWVDDPLCSCDLASMVCA